MLSKTTGIFLCILIAILIAFLIMWCASALAHHEPGNGNTDPVVTHTHSWGNVTHVHDDLKEHTHEAGSREHSHHWGGGNLEAHNTNHWDFLNYWHGSLPHGTVPAVAHSHNYFHDDHNDCCGGHHHYYEHTGDEHIEHTLEEHEAYHSYSDPPTTEQPEPTPIPDPPQTSVVTPTPNPTSNTVTVILDDAAKQEPVIPKVVKQIVEETPEPEMEDELDSQEYTLAEGWNLVMFSVVPDRVLTLAELYPHLEPATVLVVNIGGEWLMYAGEGETGEIKLHPNQGIAVYAPMPFGVTLTGHRIKLVTSFKIYAGLNLIGFSQPPPELERPSSLLSETGICVVIRATDGEFYIIGRAEDSGDTALAPNEAFMAISQMAYDLEWQTPAAPQAQRQETLAKSWGAMKQ